MTQRILVVDDDPTLRKGMALLFGASGAEVLLAESVAQGMERLAAEPSHLVLDLNLPDGLGTSVLRHIREKKLPIRVAVVTGSSDTQLLADVQSLQPDATFRKPPDWDGLMQWLASE